MTGGLEMENKKNKVLICASGTSQRGGTGCAHIIVCARAGVIEDTEVVGVLSDHPRGGVREKARCFSVKFFRFTPQTSYKEIVKKCGANLVIFCGWRHHVFELDPARTVAIVRGVAGVEEYFNTPEYAADFYRRRGDVPLPEIIVRFVKGFTVNDGPIIIRIPVEVRVGADFQLPRPYGGRAIYPFFRGTVEERLVRVIKYWVRETQRNYVPQVLNQILLGLTRWDGVRTSSLRFPQKQYEMTLRSLRINSNTRDV